MAAAPAPRPAPGPLRYDPRSPAFHADPYAVYRRLRDEAPCHHDPDTGSFALSRFEDVLRVANDPVGFSSEGTSVGTGLLPQIQQLDPPRHDELRALVSTVFTPRRVAAMEARVRAIARSLLDAMAARREPDLLRDFARYVPSAVIGDMIGVPPERQEAFLHWTEAMVAIPQGVGTQAEHVRAPAEAIYAEFARLLEERGRARRDDLMSALLDAELDGRQLSRDELLGFCFVLIVAGNDTTTNLIANGAVLLASHPDQRAWLAADATRIPAAVEEMVRFESPAQALPRIARRDQELHGVRVPARAEVKLLWGSANRDEREFPDPDRFDARREPRRHLGFGFGVHFCLGASLARLEARVAFEELLARFPRYAVVGRPGWLTSVWARAHDAVAVRLEGSAPA
jgi:cytochrome P450 family 130